MKNPLQNFRVFFLLRIHQSWQEQTKPSPDARHRPLPQAGEVSIS